MDADTPRPSASGRTRLLLARSTPEVGKSLESRVHRSSREAQSLREERDREPRIIVEREEDPAIRVVQAIHTDQLPASLCEQIEQIDQRYVDAVV